MARYDREYPDNDYVERGAGPGWLETNSYHYAIVHAGRPYPSKYILHRVTGAALQDLVGGQSTNRVFKQLGFEVALKSDALAPRGGPLRDVPALPHAQPGRELSVDASFQDLVDQLPGLLDQLVRSPARPWSDLGLLPNKGIYVFCEDDKPIYVGRTNRMRARLRQHAQPSSTHYSATFAFILAREAAAERGIALSGTRGELERDPAFSALFTESKQRVSRMRVRAIGIDDPIMQTVFEVYAAMVLKTSRYNDFDTH